MVKKITRIFGYSLGSIVLIIHLLGMLTIFDGSVHGRNPGAIDERSPKFFTAETMVKLPKANTLTATGKIAFPHF